VASPPTFSFGDRRRLHRRHLLIGGACAVVVLGLVGVA